MIAVVARDDGSSSRLAQSAARRELAAHGFGLLWRTPAVAGDAASQAVLLAQVLQTRPRAVVVLAVSYRSLLPYLRLAHDASVPVIVADTPRDLANPTFVISFVSADEALRARQIAARVPAGGGVLVMGSAESGSGQRLAAALRVRLPGRRVVLSTLAADPAITPAVLHTAVAAHRDLHDVLLADALVAGAATSALRAPGTRVTSAVDTAAGAALLRSGTVAAVIAPTPCVLVVAGLKLALAAAAGDATRLTPEALVPSRVATAATGAVVAPAGRC